MDLIQNRTVSSGVLPKLNIQNEPPKAQATTTKAKDKGKKKEDGKEEKKEENKGPNANQSKKEKKGKGAVKFLPLFFYSIMFHVIIVFVLFAEVSRIHNKYACVVKCEKKINSVFFFLGRGNEGKKNNQINDTTQKKKADIKLEDHLQEIEFIKQRIELFDKLYAEQQKGLESKKKSIKITLPDGNSIDGVAFETSPFDVAKNISLGLAKRAIVARVNDKLFDLTRPLEDDCKLEILTFDDSDGKHVFWHSSSHVLGESLERLFKGQLTVGPALDPSQMLHNGGFYYDVDISSLGDDTKISEHHYGAIEEFIKTITKDKQPFHRVMLTKEQALEMFKYKQELISEKIPDGATCTAYRCGPLIDLCKGPHIPNTDLIKAVKLVKNGATYWRNDSNRDSLQRIYGISFPDNKLMKEYEERKKMAEENDHRKIGQDQQLFFFHDLSPGSCFWLPHGARIYNKLQQFISGCYRDRGFTEVCFQYTSQKKMQIPNIYAQVISPNVYNFKLWEVSGHAQNYAENMFLFESEGQQFGLKPMNCPGHCLMFKSSLRSYRDLPLRFADFGALHRNEMSGSLTGLTRVRRFQQDDAHIFCRRDQIHQEVSNCLHFLDYVYGKFGFRFELALSTRPKEKYLGDIKVWDEAERMLAQALDDFVAKHSSLKAWKYNHGDGAFYGPKVDIHVYDSLHRQHQCATIQLDFQLPIRFELDFKAESGGVERPVIVHRAIYGSFERFIAILSEHLGGKWPFWLSPRQVCIIPVTGKVVYEFTEYAQSVREIMHKAGYWVDVDDSRNHLPKKVRNAQVSQYNFILVVGEKERDAKAVSVRRRDNTELGSKTIDEMLAWFKELVEKYE
ncbi:threonyl-tRNA synthetase [Reticulomyxa filosa]|uniref:threonine--tRNA ligase n=1 Tax=Reticulomyxa filosa TaxID=46433 RepID=X6MRC0_RETFI|nr:threonyl-tRNA synthetase [Reticulomyxa filosa]|eukprot:ETO16553.1 threonyl-tRNA synthetase [Reticulomyxa filosa]